MRRLFVVLFVAALAAPAQAFVDQNYWGHGGTPVSNYWHNDSNWMHGIPTSLHHARIRSEKDYEEHVTVQTGNTAIADYVTVSGGLWDEAGVISCLDASLTVEAGAKVSYAAGPADEGNPWEAYARFIVGVFYTGTVHNYGTIDGWEEYVYHENMYYDFDEDGTPDPFPNCGFYVNMGIGYKYDGMLPDGARGYMFCYDGSYTTSGLAQVSTQAGSQGWLEIQEGASFESNFEMNIGNVQNLPARSSYGEVNLLGGTLDISDHWNEPAHKIDCGLKIGKADGPPPFGEAGGTGLLNLESGVFYIEGNLAVQKGTVSIGKDVDATANSDYLIRPVSYVDVWGNTVEEQHADANDFLTSVEIDIDSQSAVTTHSTMVVNGDTHMDGHLYVDNSGDRPKEGDQFTLFDGDAGQMHDGDFLSVTTNLTCGDAGYSVAVASGDWIATFTGLTGGDANADHKVSIGDLSIMAGNWNQCGFTNGYADADFNCDGCVKIGDLSIMAGTWGWELPGGGVAIPEPATLSLLCLGGLAVIRRRRS